MEWIVPIIAVLGLAIWVLWRPKPPESEARSEPMRTPEPAPSQAWNPPATRTLTFGPSTLPPDSSQPPISLAQAASFFSLECPVTPKRTDVLAVPDGLGSDLIYSVDLQAQTCSCAKFALRAHRPRDRFDRWCRHLLRALQDDQCFCDANEWHQALANDGYDGPVAALRIQLQTAGDVLVTQGTDKDWLNIYARTKRSGEKIGNASGSIARHGWSIPQQRWAWGEGPPGARELRQLLKVIDRLDVRQL